MAVQENLQNLETPENIAEKNRNKLDWDLKLQLSLILDLKTALDFYFLKIDLLKIP